jgi:16S rRNA (guanine527-N7)-methyltransferase
VARYRPLPYDPGVIPLWIELAQRASRELADHQLQRLDRYLDLLLEANTRLNLTRITDPAAAQVQHVGDALTLLPFIPPTARRIADVGSGGGVPGIPLAIALPQARFLLVESTRKKANFLRETIQRLGLTNAEVTDQRAELVARTDRRETFEVVTARAVSTLNWLAEWCLPLATKGGKVLAMKGARVQMELPDAARPIRLLGGAEPIIHPVALPGAEHLVIIEIPKSARTDPKYPRDPTTTRGKPL